MHKKRYNFEVLAYAIIALAALVQLLGPALIRTLGYDGFYSVNWIDAFPDVISDGVWYPRWLPAAFGRLGSPTFYFYPPLAFFIVTPFRFLLANASATSLYHLMGLMMSIASLFTMRYLLRVLHASAKLAWLGAVIYAFSPYHLNALYVRSGLSEHLAFVWAPLVIAGFFRVLRERNLSAGFLMLSFSWGLLIISHVPAAATVALGLLVLGIASFEKERWPRLLLAASGCVLGAGLAAFYLLPIIHFTPLAQLGYLQVTTEGLQDQLVSVANILHGHDFSVSSIGFTQYLVLLSLTIIVILKWREKEGVDLWRQLAWLGIVIFFFQAVFISRPVWNALHMTQVVQFSWRWGLIGSLVIAIIYAKVIEERYRAWVNISVAVLMGVALFFGVVADFDIRVHPRDPQRTPFDPPEYAPIWADSAKENVIRFAVSHENDPLAQDTTGRRIPIHMIARQSDLIHFAITVDTPTKVVIHHWYWPTWKARDPKRHTEIAQHPFMDGRAVLELPSGRSDVVYQLVADDSEKQGNMISLISLGGILAMGLVLAVRKGEKNAVA